MDPLARTDCTRTVSSRKRLLFCLPIQLCARVGTPDPSGTLVLAQALTFQMDRDLFAVGLLLGLRSVQPVGEPELHGHAGDRLLRSRNHC